MADYYSYRDLPTGPARALPVSTEPEDNFFSDITKSVAASAIQIFPAGISALGSAVAGAIGAENTARETASGTQYWSKQAENVLNSMSEAGKIRQSKEFATLDADKSIFMDPAAFIQKGLGTAVSIIPGLGTGATAARLGLSVWKTALLSGIVEGAVAAGASTADVINLVESATPEELAKLPGAQELLDGGMSVRDIRDTIRNKIAPRVALSTGISTGILGAAGGAGLHKVFGGEGGKLLRRTAVGAATEAGTEAVQGLGETMIKNVATGRPIFEGAPEEVLAGFFFGGTLGGGLAAVAGKRTRDGLEDTTKGSKDDTDTGTGGMADAAADAAAQQVASDYGRGKERKVINIESKEHALKILTKGFMATNADPENELSLSIRKEYEKAVLKTYGPEIAQQISNQAQLQAKGIAITPDAQLDAATAAVDPIVNDELGTPEELAARAVVAEDIKRPEDLLEDAANGEITIPTEVAPLPGEAATPAVTEAPPAHVNLTPDQQLDESLKFARNNLTYDKDSNVATPVEGEAANTKRTNNKRFAADGTPLKLADRAEILSAAGLVYTDLLEAAQNRIVELEKAGTDPAMVEALMAATIPLHQALSAVSRGGTSLKSVRAAFESTRFTDPKSARNLPHIAIDEFSDTVPDMADNVYRVLQQVQAVLGTPSSSPAEPIAVPKKKAKAAKKPAAATPTPVETVKSESAQAPAVLKPETKSEKLKKKAKEKAAPVVETPAPAKETKSEKLKKKAKEKAAPVVETPPPAPVVTAEPSKAETTRQIYERLNDTQSNPYMSADRGANVKPFADAVKGADAALSAITGEVVPAKRLRVLRDKFKITDTRVTYKDIKEMLVIVMEGLPTAHLPPAHLATFGLLRTLVETEINTGSISKKHAAASKKNVEENTDKTVGPIIGYVIGDPKRKLVGKNKHLKLAGEYQAIYDAYVKDLLELQAYMSSSKALQEQWIDIREYLNKALFSPASEVPLRNRLEKANVDPVIMNRVLDAINLLSETAIHRNDVHVADSLIDKPYANAFDILNRASQKVQDLLLKKATEDSVVESIEFKGKFDNLLSNILRNKNVKQSAQELSDLIMQYDTGKGMQASAVEQIAFLSDYALGDPTGLQAQLQAYAENIQEELIYSLPVSSQPELIAAVIEAQASGDLSSVVEDVAAAEGNDKELTKQEQAIVTARKDRLARYKQENPEVYAWLNKQSRDERNLYLDEAIDEDQFIEEQTRNEQGRKRRAGADIESLGFVGDESEYDEYNSNLYHIVNGIEERSGVTLPDSVLMGRYTAKDIVLGLVLSSRGKGLNIRAVFEAFELALSPQDPMKDVLRALAAMVEKGGISDAGYTLLSDKVMLALSDDQRTTAVFVQGRLDGKYYASVMQTFTETPTAFLASFAHEVAHTVTAHTIKSAGNSSGRDTRALLSKEQLQAVEDAKGLQQEFRDWIAANPEHGLHEAVWQYAHDAAPEEFIAEALSSYKLKMTLSRIPSKVRSTGEVTTLWQKVLDVIARLIGLPKIDNSVLEQTLRTADKLFMPISEFTDITARAAYGEGTKKIINLAPAEESVAYTLEDIPGAYRSTLNIMKTSPAEEVAPIESGIDMLYRDDDIHESTMSQAKEAAQEASKKTSFYANALLLGMQMLGQIQSTYRHMFEGTGNILTVLANPLDVFIKASKAKQAEARRNHRKYDVLYTAWRKLDRSHSEDMKRVSKLMVAATLSGIHVDKAFVHEDNLHLRTRQVKGELKALSDAVIAKNKEEHAKLSTEFKKLDPKVQQHYRNVRATLENIAEEHRVASIRRLAAGFKFTSPVHIAGFLAADTMEDMKNIGMKVAEKGATKKESEGKIPYSTWKVFSEAVIETNNRRHTPGPYFPLMRFGDFVIGVSKRERHAGFSTRGEAQEAARILKAEDPGVEIGKFEEVIDGVWEFDATNRTFQAFESEVQARKAEAVLKKRFANADVEVSNVTLRHEYDYIQAGAANALMAAATKKLTTGDKDKGANAALAAQAIRSAFIDVLPETSIQKRLLRRAYIPGATEDMSRVYANYVQSSGWALAELKHGSLIADALADLQTADSRSDNSANTVRMGQVIREINAHNKQNAVLPGAISRVAAKGGFIYFLMNMSYSIMNGTQTFLLTAPYLYGIYGGSAKGSLLSAYKSVVMPILRKVIETRGGAAALYSEIDIESVMDQIISNAAGDKQDEYAAGTAEMLKTLADSGIIDATFSLEISEAAKGKTPMINTLIEAGRVMPHLIEITNRATTAIAAYRLERKRNKGGDHRLALEAAQLAVEKTQFDYSELNRPRYFKKSELLRTMMMFKIHPIGVYGLLIGNVMKLKLGKDAAGNKLKGAALEAAKDRRLEGIRALIAMGVTHSMLAGTAGVLLAEPIKLMLGLLALAIDAVDDDDDRMQKARRMLENPDATMREALYLFSRQGLSDEAAKGLAETITHGMPRLAGADFSTRLGLQNLLLQWSFRRPSEWQYWGETAVSSALGPILGMEDGFGRMFDSMQNGNSLGEALEHVLPKQIRDAKKAVRYGTKGMTDFNGNVIRNPEDFSPMALIWKIIGFAPAVEANTNMARSVVRRLDDEMTKNKRLLTNKWKNADPMERSAIWTNEIQAFNRTLLPELRSKYLITMSGLHQGLKDRREKERSIVHGVAPSDKKLRGFTKQLTSFIE